MPILANAKKALRRSQKAAEVNARVRSRVRTAVKAMQVKPSEEALKTAYTALDTAAKRKVIHPNTAARTKSRLSKLVSSKK